MRHSVGRVPPKKGQILLRYAARSSRASSRAGLRPASERAAIELDSVWNLAYQAQAPFSSLAARWQVCDQLELIADLHVFSDLSQTGQSYLDMSI